MYFWIFATSSFKLWYIVMGTWFAFIIFPCMSSIQCIDASIVAIVASISQNSVYIVTAAH